MTKCLHITTIYQCDKGTLKVYADDDFLIEFCEINWKISLFWVFLLCCGGEKGEINFDKWVCGKFWSRWIWGEGEEKLFIESFRGGRFNHIFHLLNRRKTYQCNPIHIWNPSSFRYSIEWFISKLIFSRKTTYIEDNYKSQRMILNSKVFCNKTWWMWCIFIVQKLWNLIISLIYSDVIFSMIFEFSDKFDSE